MSRKMYEVPTTHVRPRTKQSEEQLKWAPLLIAEQLERIAKALETIAGGIQGAGKQPLPAACTCSRGDSRAPILEHNAGCELFK